MIVADDEGAILDADVDSDHGFCPRCGRLREEHGLCSTCEQEDDDR